MAWVLDGWKGCERERGVFGLVRGGRECVCLDGWMVDWMDMGVEKTVKQYVVVGGSRCFGEMIWEEEKGRGI